MSRSRLADHLDRLRTRAPELANRIESARLDGIEARPARTGTRILQADGVLLGSEYDPERETSRTATSIADERPDIVVALGFGLGLEWSRLRELHPAPLLIFEPSPARLRAALDLDADFPWLGDEDVFLVDSARELSACIERLYVPGLQLKVSVQPSAQRLAPEAVRDAVRLIGTAKDTVDVTFATRYKRAADWTEQAADNAPHYLSHPGFGVLGTHFAGRPAVIAAAGPSLDRQLPTLARMQDRVLTFAVGPSLGALRQAGIEPDFVHLLESTNVSHQLTRSGSTRDLNLILTPKCHASLYELDVRSRFVAYTASDGIALWASQQAGGDHVVSSAPSVAMQAVWIAAALGANPILLIGQDLAFTGGRVYAQGSCYEEIEAEVDESGRFSYTNMERRIDAYDGDPAKLAAVTTQRTVWVPGWDGEPVPTCVSYASFRHGFAEMGAVLASKGTRLVNCTEGGARIDGIEHEPFGKTVEAFPPLPADTQPHIDATLRSWRRPRFSDFEEPAKRHRKALERIRRTACRAARSIDAMRSAPEAHPDVAANLERAGRLQQRVSDAVGEVPWLEMMLQTELQQALTLQRRADRATPTPDEALEEVGMLFRATEAGAVRASQALRRLEDALLVKPAPRSRPPQQNASAVAS